MAESFEITNPNPSIMYAFRFGTSDKVVHLTQEQLDTIPYLSVLVTHKDDFLSVQNSDGEYILNYPIEYTCFMSVLRSGTCLQPYTLFNKLSKDENILDTLELFDYLGINSFSLPLLKYGCLIRTNPPTEKEERPIKYYKANLFEARQTAAEFIIALARKEYDLNDYRTIDSIFPLVKVILSNPDVFSSRFRHHTFTVVEACCSSLFSEKRNKQLFNIQHNQTKPVKYIYGPNQRLPYTIRNAFAWKGVYDLTEANDTTRLLIDSETHASLIRNYWDKMYPRFVFDRPYHGFCRSYLREWLPNIFIQIDRASTPIDYPDVIFENDFFNETLFQSEEQSDLKRDLLKSLKDKENQKRLAQKSHLAELRCFSALSKRPTADKFKHRPGPKAKKY